MFCGYHAVLVRTYLRLTVYNKAHLNVVHMRRKFNFLSIYKGQCQETLPTALLKNISKIYFCF